MTSVATSTTTVPAAELPGDWSGVVVFCAATAWDGNRMSDQHIAERLARYAPVLYVDPPRPLVTRGGALHPTSTRPELQLVHPQLARVTPVGPPAGGRRGVRWLTDLSTRRSMRTALHRLGDPPVHAVVAASFAPVLGGPGGARRVFYSTDDFVAGADLLGVSARALARHEARQLRCADTVIVCSPGLETRYRDVGLDPVLVPNGCDGDLFASTDEAPMPSDVDLPAPIAGFVGHLTDRIDFALLEAVAARGRSLLLVGAPSPVFDATRLDALARLPNVRVVGRKAFEELPSYLRVMDVGLLPYRDSAFNRASFPLKVLEYLGAGRGAVSTDLPAVRWLDSPFISVASTPTDFADATDAALETPRSAPLVAARQAFAARHSWTRRAEEFARAVGLETGGP